MTVAAELTEQGSRIAVQCGYHQNHLIQSVPGASYAHNAWSVPVSWSACMMLRGVFGSELTLGPRLTAWAQQLRAERLDPATALRDVLEIPESERGGVQVALDALDEIEADSTYKLYGYQRADLAYNLTSGRFILANEQGLGKTGTVIRTLQVMQALGMDPFPAVIVCPNSLKHTVWKQEIARWAPELSVSVVDGSAAQRRKQLAVGSDVYVVNYEGLRLHSNLAKYGQIELTDAEKTPKELNALSPHTFIADEGHKIKDPHAKQTRAAWALAHQAEYRIVMTGTPVGNNIADLWTLLHLIEPTWFPAKTKWLARYAVVTENYWGGSTVSGIRPDTREELFRSINPLMRRVPKAAALPQLPPKLATQYRETPMTPKQAKAYRQMNQEMLAWLEQVEDGMATTKFAKGALSQLTRLIQFASACGELLPPHEVRTTRPDGSVTVELVQDVQLTAPSSKVDDLVELLEEMGDKPLVVAAVSRQLIDLAAARLEKEGIPYGLITGGVTPVERDQAVSRFQSGETRVILLTLGAGAVGITLTRADTMLFMQRSFSEIENQQAEARIHRIGSEKHACITVIDQITPDSVEQHKLDLLGDKAERMEEIVRDKAALRKLLGA